ncbi:MAG: DUF4159 domain-containing protein [Anaerolineae bacterium]|nr:DUF4159 domain-containing protein [Phycisphaerae bacterium]
MNRAIICVLIAAICTYPIAPHSAIALQTSDEAPANRQLPGSSRTPLLSKVEDSIARGVKYLLGRQNADGSFGDENAVPSRRVGETALATLALLNSGESHQSPKLAKAITFLRKTKSVGRDTTYAIALRACVWATLPEPVRGSNLKADLGWLLTSCLKTRDFDGLYAYGFPSRPDFSNSQYGVLGVWYAQLAGLEVPTNYWNRVEKAWRKYQEDDGGWAYVPSRGSASYASMTAAGAATLYITNDYLHASESQDLMVPTTNKELDRAIEWLGKNFAADYNAGLDTDLKPKNDVDAALAGLGFRRRDNGSFVHYMLFGYERVGEASGLTRFGKHRWFEEGARFLLETQAYDGSWDGRDPVEIGPVANTSYSLLFLSRGRSPVAIQKLQFGPDGKGRWNNRPRDAANFVRFMRHATERHMNWQIVSADAPLEDLREAPILYLASDRLIDLTESQRQNLLTYVNEGGLLLFVNEGATDAFAKSVTALCKDLWPRYSFRDLPADHPVKQNNFPMNGWTDPIRGLSNGVRELAILMPSGDVSWKWQAGGGATQVNLSPYAPLGNLSLYLNDKSNPRYKGEASWIERDSSADDAPTRRFVARLKFNGDWNPEPLGWKRIANLLHNAQDCEVHSDAIDLAPGKLKIAYTLAHLTSTGKFDLKAQEREALKSYIDKGGTLLFDAAGGSTEATAAFEALMAALYPGVQPAPLSIDHPIYTGSFEHGRPIERFDYRRGAPGRLAPTKLPRLKAYTVKGRVIAIESPEDLSAAMVGYPTGGITGYTPATAVQIIRNVVMWSDAPKK